MPPSRPRTRGGGRSLSARSRPKRSRLPSPAPRSPPSSFPRRGVSSSTSTSPSSRMARALLVATYSIAACDPQAGQWGVATQSKFLAVGSVVPWAEPGVGAIATQAYANPRYGPDGLALLREGLSAEEAVRQLTEADDGRDERQVGVVDGAGRAASFTGAGCMDWAGGRTGTSFAAQG